MKGVVWKNTKLEYDLIYSSLVLKRKQEKMLLNNILKIPVFSGRPTVF